MAPTVAAPHSATENAATPQQGNCSQCGQDLKFKARPKGDENGLKNIDEDVPDDMNQLSGLPEPPSKPHPDFRHCMPPEDPVYRKFSLFTAGSIEMGAAVQWQKLLAQHLSDLPITVLNPRRGNWDPRDIPKADNKGFKDQVEWELDALQKATVICYFFDVTTRSPVTMLELGLWAASQKIIVCCDERFWRSGNIKLVCDRYDIPIVHSFKDLVPAVRNMLKEKGMKDCLDANGNIKGPNERPKDLKADNPMDFNSH